MLHTEGARVFACDINGTALHVVTETLDDVVALPLDVRDETAWEQVTAMVLREAGRLTTLVNCVGVSASSPLQETPLEQWRQVFSVNLDGAFLGTKHAMRAMQQSGGVIVHIGSASGTRAAAGAAAYSSSKAALRMLVAVAAKECRDAGNSIRINCVSPAGVKTPMWTGMPFFRELIEKTGSEKLAFEALSASGGGSFSEAEEIARIVRFLVSDDARHINGAELLVDDGFVL
jgi:NAD(P)-dependent dehydrogenase (short-subunit alcohol dehydrogenase family)